MTSDRSRRRVLSGGVACVLLLTASVTGSAVRGQASILSATQGANDYTLVLRDRAGPYRYWRALTEGNAYRKAVGAFGPPTSRGKDAPASNVCTVRWEDVGIDIGFSWAPGPCGAKNLDRAAWAGMRLFGSRWKTSKGLHVGDPVVRIKRVYPRSRYVSRPPQPGEWWLLLERRSELGIQPLLVAEVGAGRVIALRVPPAGI